MKKILRARMDEKELVIKSKEGDEKAFEELVNRTKENVFYHCLGLVKDEEIAKDLTQETFLHAFRHLADFRMEAKFSTWVWKISQNLSLNYLKKKHIKDTPLKEEITPTPHPFSSAEKEDEEMVQKIYEALPLLDEKHRKVFELYELKHLSQKQIAAELGIPHGTVRSRLHYARKKLKKILLDSFKHKL